MSDVSAEKGLNKKNQILASQSLNTNENFFGWCNAWILISFWKEFVVEVSINQTELEFPPIPRVSFSASFTIFLGRFVQIH